MKPSTEDQINGKVQAVKGALTERAGQISGDPDLGSVSTRHRTASATGARAF